MTNHRNTYVYHFSGDWMLWAREEEIPDINDTLWDLYGLAPRPPREWAIPRQFCTSSRFYMVYAFDVVDANRQTRSRGGDAALLYAERIKVVGGIWVHALEPIENPAPMEHIMRGDSAWKPQTPAPPPRSSA